MNLNDIEGPPAPLPPPKLDPPIMAYFKYEHLKAPLRDVSKACHDLARNMVDNTPVSAELIAGLRKLLEAKDCFVRARLP